MLVISVLCAFERPMTLRANSITAHCIPRQIPKNGILFSRKYFIVVIFPSIPRSPKPGATKIPSKSFKRSFTLSEVIFSEDRWERLTLHSFSAPACMNASLIDLYASGSSTYLPMSPILTSFFGCLSLNKKFFQCNCIFSLTHLHTMP